MRPRANYRISFWFGVLSAVAIFAAVLALQDIYDGETDLSLEWSALRVSFLIVIAFHVAALRALWSKSAFDTGAGSDGRTDQTTEL